MYSSHDPLPFKGKQMIRSISDKMYFINDQEYTIKEYCDFKGLDSGQFACVRNRIYAFRYSNPNLSVEKYSQRLAETVEKVKKTKILTRQISVKSSIYNINGENYTVRDYCEKMGINDSIKIHKIGAFINNKRQHNKNPEVLSELLVNYVKKELNTNQTVTQNHSNGTNHMSLIETLDKIPLSVLEEYLELRHKKNEFDNRRSKINQMLIGEIKTNSQESDPIKNAIAKIALKSNANREWLSAEKWVDMIKNQNLTNAFFNKNEQNSNFVMSMKMGKILSKFEGQVFDVDVKENGSYKVKLQKQKKSGDPNSSKNEYRFLIHID